MKSIVRVEMLSGTQDRLCAQERRISRKFLETGKEGLNSYLFGYKVSAYHLEQQQPQMPHKSRVPYLELLLSLLQSFISDG